MKLLIDKKKLEARIAELEKYPNDVNNGKAFELESILQQGEEYNENEAIEFAEWVNENGYSLYNTMQELFKLYKDERKNNLTKINSK